ncbi:MAG: hypothetical protein M1838_000319 [Thelocarpon superellum]|nr:MAG: hypothetical protein M1838_000319 [Thelocarpon superellum]
MKAAPHCILWHNDHSPIYAAHFESHGKGRLATAGGDNNVRLWKLESNGEDRKVVYLTTLIKHTQAVNVVRFCPRGEMLASAGDDGNVLLWVPSDTHSLTPSFGEEGLEDKETWRIKHMCRSSGSEIYDLAWSPDGVFFITGSMDNVARIYNAQTGQTVRQIAEHNHYVQGVAWDPLNEFVATQSSDRSVHIYTLKSKDGQFSLAQHGKITKMDLPARRISSSSPAPPDLGQRPHFVNDASSLAIASPAPSTPGTPSSLALPMNPPALTHSRRSSFSSSPSLRRSTSPAPSLPLPAIKPMESSPKPFPPLGVRNANLYANETFTSFFRRLTFAPDGSLLFTPAGQYKTAHPLASESGKTADDVINTVYIYTRAGFNKPPIAHLPGHKKPSIAVKCSPIYYSLRKTSPPTKHIAVDTSSSDDSIPSLPEPAISSKTSASSSMMEPPPLEMAAPAPTSEPSGSAPTSSPKVDGDHGSVRPGPPPTFALPYRMVYAVATQDSILVYDTQQQIPLCIVSNLHFATFTDLAWSSDGLTLLMSSSDGFCSTLSFAPGELGQVYTGQVPTAHHPNISFATGSTQAISGATTASLTGLAKPNTGITIPPSPPPPSVRGVSPSRSNSISSVATQSSLAQTPPPNLIMSNPTTTLGNLPSLAAASTIINTTGHASASASASANASASATPTASSGTIGGIPLTTPPQTPMSGNISTTSSVSGVSVLGKRDSGAASESEKEEAKEIVKKRRIAPTLVSTDGQGRR